MICISISSAIKTAPVLAKILVITEIITFVIVIIIKLTKCTSSFGHYLERDLNIQKGQQVIKSEQALFH